MRANARRKHRCCGPERRVHSRPGSRRGQACIWGPGTGPGLPVHPPASSRACFAERAVVFVPRLGGAAGSVRPRVFAKLRLASARRGLV